MKFFKIKISYFPKIFRKKKKIEVFYSKKFFLSYIFKNLYTWGAQGQMTHINLFVNSMPRELTEFAFFLVVGFTAGSLGLI